ncbi:39S ribosomal protein L49, mitochondrial-like [Patiria miniata]|uniref:Large ribosomal subunit protein mL49 n=1 Tax=Patiria miniata TaxID=46514 RepID=A0A914BH33_PATMI|nr:39S ribosomal protein L49, mitochondrial-like [Patiria miniata]
MALSTRSTVLSFLIIKNSIKLRTVSSTARPCIHSLLKRSISTSCPRLDSFPPNFYHPKDLVREEDARTEYIESKEDFKYVERLIPSLEPPTPPAHEKYPTPSGWAPPKGAVPGTPYTVRRTRYHSIPVYLKLKFGNTQQLTVIKNIEGDIWALAEELKTHLERLEGCTLPMRVSEFGRWVHFKGMFRDEVKQWLVEKGF